MLLSNDILKHQKAKLKICNLTIFPVVTYCWKSSWGQGSPRWRFLRTDLLVYIFSLKWTGGRGEKTITNIWMWLLFWFQWTYLTRREVLKRLLLPPVHAVQPPMALGGREHLAFPPGKGTSPATGLFKLRSPSRVERSHVKLGGLTQSFGSGGAKLCWPNLFPAPLPSLPFFCPEHLQQPPPTSPPPISHLLLQMACGWLLWTQHWPGVAYVP